MMSRWIDLGWSWDVFEDYRGRCREERVRVVRWI